MSKKRRITIEELRDEIELQIWEHGCNGFKITDMLETNREYFVDDLYIEIGNDMIFFYDTNYTLLGMFDCVLKENLLRITYIRINGCIHVDMELKYGHIFINSIAI